MKLSTKVRYATRAMLDLALHFNEGAIQIKDICERQDVSEQYLKNLLASLRAANLIRSVRGPRGGFMLARPPSQIVVMEIIQATEGTIALVDCIDAPEICSRSDLCVTRDIWTEMGDAMNAVVESMSLQDLVERQTRKKEGLTA
jgi:Rrf2 family cysteine metabolism transcriptional repressor